jgi:hypothetical protein
MKHLCQIDLHVVVILLIVVPGSMFILPIRWALLVVALFPQGIILTHAADLRRSRHPAAGYVLINESFLVLLLASFLLGWSVIHRH